MYSKKSVVPWMEVEELQHQLDIIVETSHLEPPKAVCYWEKTN